ncbi:MAG: hypothetical protein M3066_02580 [Actinomycetota bacterium]|nr:hypothetical protein [Actinomycetota bacterium]
MFEQFYSTFATVSLTVTGLWVYVVQARFRDWLGDRDHFRRASAVSVQLAFPGVMCLFALIDPASVTLWRAAFGITSGVAVLLLLGLGRRTGDSPPGANEVAGWIAAVLFASIGVVAFAPGVVGDLGLTVLPRRVEFLLFCVLLLNGLVIAWLMLFAEAVDSGPAREEHRNEESG